MNNPKVDIIFGGQYGSEGKRLFNEYYFHKYNPDTIVSNFGPNSGGFDSNGNKWTTFATNAPCLHLLSPGSIINITDFWKEQALLPKDAKILIHENATIITENNIEKEKNLIQIGSTMRGTSTSIIQKINRDPKNINTANKILPEFTISARNWFELLKSCKHIQLAIPQGHSLSLNHGFYPYCTSRNTSPQQGLADAGIPIQWVDKIIACMRTYPIRVANHFDNIGNMIGYSGPYYQDQHEITWNDIKQVPELTTISKKVRRLFSFSIEQYKESCLMNGVTNVFMNFINYLNKDNCNEFYSRLNNISKISWFGYGPTINDIKEIG
ncbi:MAG: adenylosuccinate synthetase [Candidatus Omnitrophica bacterium]|jgi:adenylosuccinate synthase|nr:adenylosuccinate synthetase [Candidatus Omnitrophota bacterium]